jgi:diguanylate cyclase (GGDEF)-like protein
MIYEFHPDNLVDYFYTNMTSLITGVSRLSYLERELEKTTEELYEVQEELARDDSVLDHIGDQDYLTGGLNRRGFFAKAYDLLKDNFVDGKYAVVTYIHMESLKRINDMYGHEEGDRAVKRVAKVLEEVFGGCIYGRIRGDEFAVLMIEDEEGRSESLREEMQSQNAKLLEEPGRYINHLQYSICEFSHEENLSLREMLKETDENLKRIKGNL